MTGLLAIMKSCNKLTTLVQSSTQCPLDADFTRKPNDFNKIAIWWLKSAESSTDISSVCGSIQPQILGRYGAKWRVTCRKT